MMLVLYQRITGTDLSETAATYGVGGLSLFRNSQSDFD